ncbi:hypothetical protein B4123_0237 [Bacillus paralicheniformis]|uniref:Uncharacterized protein n=1 Tax=Bacillus paralicheniformis TaxID=1648923 RepID=A0ABY3FXW5_9BACI|nr:hypothetical protein B4123_0237 [Bacillus paralicheniformis]TWL41069.1 hypothetical protein CHCC15381_1607 [Bacillus paralicheniformis]TWM56255.1 hypothetical protein CHCC14814_2236 [Bacillus paralicheniformis]TWN91970.1 hypothetical protein CHCC20490_2919 [Bacillus paralicheniformis]
MIKTGGLPLKACFLTTGKQAFFNTCQIIFKRIKTWYTFF